MSKLEQLRAGLTKLRDEEGVTALNAAKSEAAKNALTKLSQVEQESIRIQAGKLCPGVRGMGEKTALEVLAAVGRIPGIETFRQ